MHQINQLDLICLGVGTGQSYIMRGIPSTSFTVCVDDQPYLQVDCGAGIALSCQRHLGIIPGLIYITHNHTDHTGDLPTAVKHTETPPHLVGHRSVLDLVRQHRLHDDPATMRELIDSIRWTDAATDNSISLGYELQLRLFRSQHSYICYGFVMTYYGRPILGYTADSGFDHAIYDRVSAAPVALVDGRDEGSSDHAALTEIDSYARTRPETAFYVVHYEQTDYRFSAPNVRLLREGDRVLLTPGR